MADEANEEIENGENAGHLDLNDLTALVVKEASASRYPVDTRCRACRYYNAAVVREEFGGPIIDIGKEAEILHLLVHTTAEHGSEITFAVGSPAHMMLCRLIEGVRRLERQK